MLFRSCAGGTGAFIDQMSTLLDTDAAGLNEMAKSYENLYPIVSLRDGARIRGDPHDALGVRLSFC